MIYPLKFGIACHEHSVGLILPDYIYHKNEKIKSRKMDLPLLKNDIPLHLIRTLQKYKICNLLRLQIDLVVWCRRGDSNSHGVTSTRP